MKLLVILIAIYLVQMVITGIVNIFIGTRRPKTFTEFFQLTFLPYVLLNR